ncbi:acyl-CoA dehydrogenase family protein [Pseudofrankia asymbiotica]|uniref:Acyl-CoA dehydrogenase n=2 Tax=Pseudofrankia asymbiotica TaxID=1834516 RepID=A0A1V2HZC4_9ACTN|nr:acyl-CoA dehydrogenase family protein [Pseudofrankia asymbiotica]ONH21952.1 acyl-CoA dehydrogenase [Pseudofrankia asymbiotica]
MTDPPHDPTLADYRASVRDWLAATDIPSVPLDLDHRFEVLKAWQGTLYDAGWVGISWSRESGGQGLTPLHQLVFSEELARARAPMPIGLIGLDVVGPSIDTYASSEQRARLLPPLLSGDEMWCQGFSEPNAGSDLASLRTTAKIDGDRFVVNGQKVWTSWAHKARWCALLARTDSDAPKHRGISYIAVDMATPGVSVRPLVQMTGDSEFCEVFFDDVEVPRGNLIGDLNAGWTIAQDTLSHERGSYTLRRMVEYDVAVEEAFAEIRRHRSAGGTVAPRTLEQLGRAYVSVRGLEAQTRKTMARKVRGEVPSPYDSVDKLSLNEVEQRVYSSISDLLGPFRLTPHDPSAGLDSARWVKDHYYSRAVSIYGGTSQVQRNIIADRLLELPRG